MKLHTLYTHILQFLKLTHVHGRRIIQTYAYTYTNTPVQQPYNKIRAENNTNTRSNNYIPFRQCSKQNNNKQGDKQSLGFIVTDYSVEISIDAQHQSTKTANTA